MMTFLTKNIMTLICQIEFDIKNIYDTYFTCRNTHTMCTNCRYMRENNITISYKFSPVIQLKRLKEKILKKWIYMVYMRNMYV